MNDHFLKILKAACISAAFLFCTAVKPISSLENIKNKTAQLLSLNKKEQALQLISNYLNTERSRAHKNEAQDLLFSVAQGFLTKEAQESYEASLNSTLEDEVAALKSVERCLKIEEQNLDCLIQKARLVHRAQNKRVLKNTMSEIKNLLEPSTYSELLGALFKQAPNGANLRQGALNLSTPPNDKTMLFVVLEIDRSFLVKNYSRTKELLLYAEKYFLDWPDLAYFKNRLNEESTENRELTNDDLLTYYSNKCKSISKSNARKYKYDFDLCNRGKKI